MLLYSLGGPRSSCRQLVVVIVAVAEVGSPMRVRHVVGRPIRLVDKRKFDKRKKLALVVQKMGVRLAGKSLA